ncbi:MAG: hypothetical protein AAF135_21835 [Bacteroidota bacterium]
MSSYLIYGPLLLGMMLGIWSCQAKKKEANREALLEAAFNIHQETLEQYREIKPFQYLYIIESDWKKMKVWQVNDSMFLAWEEAFASVPGYEDQFPQDSLYRAIDHGLSLMEDMKGEEILTLQKEQLARLKEIEQRYTNPKADTLYQTFLEEFQQKIETITSKKVTDK